MRDRCQAAYCLAWALGRVTVALVGQPCTCPTPSCPAAPDLAAAWGSHQKEVGVCICICHCNYLPVMPAPPSMSPLVLQEPVQPQRAGRRAPLPLLHPHVPGAAGILRAPREAGFGGRGLKKWKKHSVVGLDYVQGVGGQGFIWGRGL